MPCNLDGPGGRDYEYETELQRKGNRAARAACEMASLIKREDAKMPKGITLFSRLSDKTKRWVKHHEKIDKRRIAMEKAEKEKAKLRSAALAKLTKEERTALRGMVF